MRISCRSAWGRRASSRRCTRRRRERRCRCRRSTSRGRDDPAGPRWPRSQPVAASRRSCSAPGLSSQTSAPARRPRHRTLPRSNERSQFSRGRRRALPAAGLNGADHARRRRRRARRARPRRPRPGARRQDLRGLARPAGLGHTGAGRAFSGDEPAVPLSRRVGRGARVGVTLEAAPAPDRPSRSLRLVAARS